jgi:PKD repeat protein
LVYAGYIGGSGSDYGFDIEIDVDGNAYVVGRTSSTEQSFPVIGGPDLTYNGNEDGFVTKIGAPLAPAAMNLTGPITGTITQAYLFAATTMPVTTTVPLTYFWEATGQTPITHTSGLTDTAVFTWNIPGPKTITVTASNTVGAVTNTHAITIFEPVSADFTAAPTTGPAPLNVTFTNLSTGSYTTCLWDFGDGTNSTACVPTHQYTTPGLYTLSLTITGPGGTDTHTKTNHITVNPTIYLPVILKP